MLKKVFAFLLFTILFSSCQYNEQDIYGWWKLERIELYNKKDLSKIRAHYLDFYRHQLDSIKSIVDKNDSLYRDTIMPFEAFRLHSYYINLKNFMPNFENPVLFEKYLIKKLLVQKNRTNPYHFKENGVYEDSLQELGHWQLKGSVLLLKKHNHSEVKVRVLVLNDSVLRIILPYRMKHFDEDFNFVYEFRKIKHPNNKK